MLEINRKDQLLLLTPFIAFILYVIRKYAIIYVWKYIASLFRITNKREEHKFCIYAHRIFHHFIATLLAFPIIYESFGCWLNTYYDINSSCYVPMKLMAICYVYQFSYYISGFYMLFNDEKMHDFYIMILHHSLTLSLILFSFKSKLCYSGISIMWVHDLSDIFLYLLKCCQYARLTTLRKITFIFLIMTFFIFRIFMLPYNLYMHQTLVGPQVYGEQYLYILLWILILCQYYWGTILLRVAWKALNGKEIKDIREKED